ncbi:MAG: glycosyltransferase family 39 protein [Ignavibacteria bacterium]|nr:glycosyltransferase family 39 protein [Ignavibacteria bacterium]
MEKKGLNNLREYFSKFISSSALLIASLLLLKILFQIVVLSSGYRWLSADDYCRTIKSYEWLQHPEVSAGVWLTPHFWLIGFFMLFIKDLFWAALTVNFIFSFFTLIFFYKSVELSFNKFTAYFSTLIFCFFPFQVWLSISGLPESVFFFFVSAGIYYFLKWKKSGGNTAYLVLCAISFAFSNCFRYEGWLFSFTLVFLVALDFFKDKKISKQLIKNILIAGISGITILWWLIQNYIDHKDVMFFAKETTKIFEQFDHSSFFQRLVQYPTFILYIAPLTTIFAFKKIYDTFRGKSHELTKYFALFNLVQLLLLIVHGLAGTGGTNMVSRYIVMNALLFVPFAIQQCYELKRYIAIPVLTGFIIINIIWSFYYPQPFREDTFEVGNLLRSQFERNYVKPEGKVYFEEVDGYFDIWAVKTLSNKPDKFLLGNLDTLIAQRRREIAEKNPDSKKIKQTSKKTESDINILDIKTFLDSSNVQIAIVRSDNFNDKLKKLSLKNEEIGEYKVYYITDRSNYLNDSTFSIFKKKIISLKENPEKINYNKTFAIKKVEIDNSNFGLNPQTITLEWGATDVNIIDSLDYANFDFERYKSIVNIKPVDKDSVVFTIENRIFSDRNIEDLIDYNKVRNIVVLKPFALLQYSSRFGKPPFESGVYTLELKIHDAKANKDMTLFRGDSLFKYDGKNLNDTTKIKGIDSLKNLPKKISLPKDSIPTGYPIGTVIAMFPNTDYNKLVKKSSTDIYQTLMKNGLQVFFSQRYQGDHFLNWVFQYF